MPLIKELERGFRAWETQFENITPDALVLHYNDYLSFVIRQDLEQINRLQADFETFNIHFGRSLTPEEKEQHLLSYSQKLGASPRELKKDKKALKRWLGYDAMVERFNRRKAVTERKIYFCFERLAVAFKETSSDYDKNLYPTPMDYWKRLNPGVSVSDVLNYPGDYHVMLGGIRYLSSALLRIPMQSRVDMLSSETIQTLYRYSMDTRRPAWVQVEALRFLHMEDPSLFYKVMPLRLRFQSLDHDLFIRKKCLEILMGENTPKAELEKAIATSIDDPSPYVRQALCRLVVNSAEEKRRYWCRKLGLDDPVSQVRGKMALELLNWLRSSPDFVIDEVLELLIDMMDRETHPFVLRVVMKVAVDGTRFLDEEDPGLVEKWVTSFNDPLRKLQSGSPLIPVRRWAALAKEEIWCEHNPEAAELRDFLLPIIERIPPGKSRFIQRRYLEEVPQEILGRVISILSHQDFEIQVKYYKYGMEVFRGPQFGFRAWRFLHEMRHPSPDKRQAHSHTRGRHFWGTLRAPSPIMAELTQTKVPGEPLFIDYEQGWRPFLPLPDDLLSSLGHFGSKPISIYSPEGVTRIYPPRLSRRLRAWFRLTLHYTYYSDLRNWKEEQTGPPTDYIQAVRDLGFIVQFQPHLDLREQEVVNDPSVQKFFPFLSIIPGITDIFNRLKEYFISIYENSFPELIFFTVLMSAIFFGRHILLNYLQQKRRGKIPLVIGGWGTRGKSGTERLKAAMMNAVGYSVVCKTTGSDATFLHAAPYGVLQEIPIFRPYEKATIWEQFDITQIAGDLQSEVFLWECMALQPSYVKVLQKRWMRDDISTITNTYPDHEDIMGPAGIDVPEVMTWFVPDRSKLITTEEQMMPILAESAKKNKTVFRKIGWMEAGFLTPDVLDRFPYREHPYNIALVMALGEELGIDPDFALKEMGDRVVPEIGMLKTFPTVPLRGRSIQFTNGMAANERVGCLSNWNRIGMGSQDYIKEPGVFISTVVNNRADRIPRSRVFADILVRDLSADLHFLIGSNLNGLTGYIHEAWNNYAPSLQLWPLEESGNPEAVELLRRMVLRFRLPMEPLHLQKPLEIMLKALSSRIPGPTADELSNLWQEPGRLKEHLNAFHVDSSLVTPIIDRLSFMLTAYNQYLQIEKEISAAAAAERTALTQRFHNLLWEWFQKKIIVTWDFHASGSDVVNRICDETPPGFLNRVMGIQNIKGTGMDFALSWQSWDHVWNACRDMDSDNPAVFERGLNRLEAFHNFTIQGQEYLTQVLRQAKGRAIAQNERCQAKLLLIQGNFEDALSRIKNPSSPKPLHTSFFIKLLLWFEGFLDMGDAVKRKKKARRIYDDLIHERISHSRAISELRYLFKRQKGGWLPARIQQALNVFRQP